MFIPIIFKKVKKSKRVKTDQEECCVNLCMNEISNRSYDSLKFKNETEVKEGYLEKNWDRICNYDYFAQLYRWRKKE